MPDLEKMLIEALEKNGDLALQRSAQLIREGDFEGGVAQLAHTLGAKALLEDYGQGRVVAYLRGLADSEQVDSDASDWLRTAADDIERGEHLKVAEESAKPCWKCDGKGVYGGLACQACRSLGVSVG